jgi:hypothetical protein
MSARDLECATRYDKLATNYLASLAARCANFGLGALVSRFRSSHTLAATSDANFGIKGTLAIL